MIIVKQLRAFELERYKDNIMKLIIKKNSTSASRKEVINAMVKKKMYDMQKNIETNKIKVLGAVEDEILKAMVIISVKPFRDDDSRIYIEDILIDNYNDKVFYMLLTSVEKYAQYHKFKSIYIETNIVNEKIQKLKSYNFAIERIQLYKSNLSSTVLRDTNLVLFDYQKAIKYRKELIELYYLNTRAHTLTTSLDRKWVTNKIDELLVFIKECKAIVTGYIKENKLIGFMWVFPYNINKDEIYMLNAITVIPASRKLKIASKLFKHMEQILSKKNRSLYTYVDEVNVNAHQFYLKHGMKVNKLQMIKEVNYG